MLITTEDKVGQKLSCRNLPEEVVKINDTLNLYLQRDYIIQLRSRM